MYNPSTVHAMDGSSFIRRRRKANELSQAKAFDRPHTDIETLLVNAGIGKQTIQGFGIVKREWESYSNSLRAPICHGSKGRVFYIANTVPPLYKAPADLFKMA